MCLHIISQYPHLNLDFVLCTSSNTHMFLHLFLISCVQMCVWSHDGASVICMRLRVCLCLHFCCVSLLHMNVSVRVCVCLHIISRCLGGLNAHPRALLRAQLSRPHSTWRPLHKYDALHACNINHIYKKQKQLQCKTFSPALWPNFKG